MNMRLLQLCTFAAFAIALVSAPARAADTEQSLYQAAKKEGKVIVWTPLDLHLYKEIAASFAAKYPGIEIEPFRIQPGPAIERTVTEATAKRKKAAAGGKAAALLHPSSATGGPGPTRLKLALTAAAKTKLREAGKVRVRARLAFTPTGGTTALLVRSFTVKGKVKMRGHS